MNYNELFDYQNEFKSRHNGPRPHEVDRMIQTIGVKSLDQLIDETIPADIRLKTEMKLPQPESEYQFLTTFKSTLAKNKVFKSFIGMGYYPTITPSVILRNILENPGWYTQYTPYQSEISQGRLESLINFQTMVCDLTGMDIANASLLDEATAAAEAMSMVFSLRSKELKDATVFYVDDQVFPQTLDVLKTRSKPLGIEIQVGDFSTGELPENVFGVLFQYPDMKGNVRIYENFCKSCQDKQIKIVIAADLLSLTLLKEPAAFAADVVVGTTQRFGVPMGFGGPHAAYFATKEDYKRSAPGRIIGVSIDADGNIAYRMALQTREQHIRRDKATSNICTAQALLANIAAMYAVYHGPSGLKKIAERIHFLAVTLAKSLEAIGIKQTNPVFFDTIHLDLDTVMVQKIRQQAELRQLNFNYFNDGITIAIAEPHQLEDIEAIVEVFAYVMNKKQSVKADQQNSVISDHLKRKSTYLQHLVFNSYHSETDMMRYLKHLENKDLSLTHSMISLGSCTMKLNAATEMIPVTWREAGEMHPFVPMDQAAGYLEMIHELEEMLKQVTGFDGMSLQPNAGAQGEYAGLLVIKAYLESIGEGHRDVCLIPSSAHGTNPASAVMAGMKVVVVKCEDNGNIDLEDLNTKIEKNQGQVAALMVTYPSTHGVFEDTIKTVCQLIHQAGGQVYMDGANMNAQVGLTSPALIGADVCHLNLHKTFSIPHGGGGPGMGPIGTAKHLTPFLPGHALVDMELGKQAIPAVSAAPYGSGSILIISFAYISMMGANGLTEATKLAILNANYIKKRLEPFYPVLYAGKKGHVAHELIFDTRHFKQTCGVEVEDIAKRLMDYGFHAPTVSFPVPGTMMIEPTESESLDELDRFCNSLISIRKEIEAIENGNADREDNVLKNAPHPLKRIINDQWKHKYSREEAAYPVAWLKDSKFWPSISRVNNVHGDRELICTCPDISEYEETTA